MDDLHVFLVEDFPQNLRLFGESKFRTPRCPDERLPIAVLPECVTNGLATFRDKNYLQVRLPRDAACKFDGVTRWIAEVSSKPLHPFLTEADGELHMKIKLPHEFSVLNVDGSESTRLHSSDGSTVRCAVELPCLWETDDSVGLSFQMVQCKIIKNRECMIQHLDEDPQYVPFGQSSGSSVYGGEISGLAGAATDMP